MGFRSARPDKTSNRHAPTTGVRLPENMHYHASSTSLLANPETTMCVMLFRDFVPVSTMGIQNMVVGSGSIREE